MSSFAYGGTALAFNLARGSLFLVGHPYGQQVAEVSVPEIRKGLSVWDLDTAELLQPLTEATEGKISEAGPNTVNIGGLLPYQDQLYLTAYVAYDGTGSQTRSHFVSGLDLSVPGDVRGPYRVGRVGAGFVSGYFGLVPTEWQAALGGPVLNGQCCLGVVSPHLVWPRRVHDRSDGHRRQESGAGKHRLSTIPRPIPRSERGTAPIPPSTARPK